VTTPEDALERARSTAASMREAGAYPVGETGAAAEADEQVSAGRLLEWALIEPDLRQVRSDRPWGAPITAVKRMLLRLLAQYHGEVLGQQARFNAGLLRYVRGLEARIEALERVAGKHAEQEDEAG
jgi:hypothetical protein